MEPTTFLTAATALKTLVETVRTLKPTSSESQLEAIRVELLAQVGNARQGVLDLQETVAKERAEKAELEAEIARLRSFEAYRERYKLEALGDDALVYVQKDSSDSTDPPHSLCAACFNKDIPSILQFERFLGRYIILLCSTCDSRVRYRRAQSDKTFGVAAARGYSRGTRY